MPEAPGSTLGGVEVGREQGGEELDGPRPEVSGAVEGDVEVGISGVDGDVIGAVPEVPLGSDEDADDDEWL